MAYANPATLHLHYDIEKPGYHVYDRRHYPEKHSFTLTEPVYKPRGRAHIPSPPLEDERWRPHGQHIEPVYSNFGPDWQSSIRPIKSPRNPNAKPTLPVGIIERNIHFMRPYPQNWQRTNNEWIYFNDESVDHRPSKRNFFANVYLRSLEDLGDENVHMESMGHKRKVADPRNGLQKRSEGDKSYRGVELSPNFYKFGCTLPAVDFGRLKKRHGPKSRFVPMKNEKIPVTDENEFEEKERKRENNQIIEEVIQLENWTPVESMTRAFTVFDMESNDKEGGKYRPRFR
ncbi:unnamed protein product [Rotaria magnacalcarata]|uniref:Uncharacterized protein n=2 Tax=Rotaria magnacalcarata TaxID=392030 RepID=A0A816VTI1_9BILA|nr:unnamed protein product [Rotaria magnacalcarata]CAF1376641.1 unnamed protein product [Rotaria magnacalcarata]CAF2098235.1 unnamed protein product [Rotaria magnacalcarata]CAF2124815.1 unnamed protein product [Rotaria magnacalcarata]CAF3900790.1 unnamed protein product [Rotaria magnacalcarata]